MLWRHHHSKPVFERKPLPAFDTITTQRTDDTVDVVPVVTEAPTTPVEAAPPAPVHVHPPSFEWSHVLHSNERRPRNFALNGEHAQHNEEKLTPIFERARVAGLETPGLVTAFFSPQGRLKLSILMSEEGKLGYMLDVIAPQTTKGASAVYVPLLAPAFLELNANYASCVWNTKNSFGAQVHWQLEFGESFWRPVPGNERRHFHEKYQQAKVWCEGPQCIGCDFLWELRLYDRALAIRAVVDGTSIQGLAIQPQENHEAEYAHLDFGMGVRLPYEAQGVTAQCWGQNSEDPYTRGPCALWKEPTMTPITARLEPMEGKDLPPGVKAPVLPYRYLSILQADGPAFMRSMVQSSLAADPLNAGAKSGVPNALYVITRGELPIHAQETQLGVIEHDVLGWSTPTSWNVIFVAESAAELVHSNSIIYMLCPPPSEHFPMAYDARWVVVGKSLRVRGHATAKAKYMVDFAATYNYQIVHFDAGWYGDENNKSSRPQAVAPEYIKDLDIVEVSHYARSRGVATTLYVNEIALKDTLDLLDIYPRWGVSGIKFGFVDVNSPHAMRILHERMIAYQHVGLVVNIHDIYRPRGLSRTWPHLVTQEGVRGEERKPDSTHHTILPFVRLLQGSADYTPRYLKGALRCTRAHQLALPLILFSPIQSLFWAEPGQAISEAVQLYHPELIVWQMMPTVWDDTRVLSGEVGEHAVIARRAGADWFIGAITNDLERTLSLNLSSLFDHTFDGSAHPLSFFDQDINNRKGYSIHYYEDDHSYAGSREGTDVNNMRVKLRQSFILPAQFSTQVAHATRAAATAAQGIFPSDPVSSHLAALHDYRRKINLAQEKQLGNAYTKETGKGIPPAVEIKSPIFNIKMAAHGGAVLYLTPIL